MTSGNPVLVTVFPTPREVLFAGQVIRVGKLKQRQKADIQAFLDNLPEPNGRVEAGLKADAELRGYNYVWPLSIDKIAVLLDLDYESRYAFLRIAIKPHNLGLSDDQINELVDNCDSDDEVLDVLFAAFGVEPAAAKQAKADPAAESTSPKKDDPAEPLSTGPGS